MKIHRYTGVAAASPPPPPLYVSVWSDFVSSDYKSISKTINVIIMYYFISDMACKRIHAIGVYSFAAMGRNIQWITEY